ncbi:MAG: hypothetical protein CM1200mP12_17360 [Gammaproteobacteria bacterium]|nr:MAG: hypothetical protein CM1200mP12_17360 [Gammaproteobacteria bacterium]
MHTTDIRLLLKAFSQVSKISWMNSLLFFIETFTRNDFKKTKKDTTFRDKVVPYIDVMLVLLVVFMIAAPLMVQGF